MSSLFSSGSQRVVQALAPNVTVQAPAAPTPLPPATMPDLFGPASQEAARRTQAQALASGGRSATILTTAASRAQNTIAGGGATYGSAKLGAK